MSIQIPQRDPRRLETLKSAIAQIEKQFGKGAIMRLGEEARLQVEGISTGSIRLDLALGGKGFPRGRVVEVFGPEGSGKTTLCLSAVANAQRAGGIAAYVDAEHALDPTWARKIGVETKDLLLSQPDSGEQALEITEQLVRTAAVDVIVVDSVAALVPKSELEGEMGEAQVGLQARLMSQALRKLTAAIAKSATLVLFINQLREKIGVMFGNPETTPGGRALKYYSSVRVDVRRIGAVKDGEQTIGARVVAHVVKNKLAPPFQKAEFELLYDSGISREGELLDLGEKTGVLSRSGAWFTWGDTKLGQGRESSRQFLREHRDVADRIEREIRRALGVPVAEDAEAPAPPEKPAEAPQAKSEKERKERKASAKP